MAEFLLNVENVHKSFGDTRVLEDVSLSLERGEVKVMVGPSGSGKSTLLKCINKLEGIDSGEVYLDGRRMSRTDATVWRQDIGMVFQEFNLFTHLTALENVTLGLKHVRGLSDTAAAERARSYLDRVGVEERSDAYPASLSGGQKQRVGIARALAMEPEMMLFDEPTSSLDPELVGEILDLMLDLARQGMTMLVVTHEIEFARDVATDMLFLADGHIVERGDPERMINDPEEQRTREFFERLRMGMLDG